MSINHVYMKYNKETLFCNGYLVKQQWQLFIRQRALGCQQLCDRLLVRWTETVLCIVSIAQPKHLLSHEFPAAAPLPELGSTQSWHVDFLPTNGLHFLINEPHQLLHGAQGSRKVVEAAWVGAINETSLQHQPLAAARHVARILAFTQVRRLKEP